MTATDGQVQAVRIRLLHSSTIATLRQRNHIDDEALALVVDHCVRKHGLHGDLEKAAEALFWNWRSNPRLTLAEYIRSLP